MIKTELYFFKNFVAILFVGNNIEKKIALFPSEKKRDFPVSIDDKLNFEKYSKDLKHDRWKREFAKKIQRIHKRKNWQGEVH